MIGESTVKNKLPIYLVWFIIASSMSQIIGISNSIIDTAIKLLILGVFSLVVIRGNDLLNINVFTMLYIILFVGRSIATIIVNQVGIVSGFIEIFTTIIIFYLLFEKPRGTKIITTHSIMEFYKIFVYFMIIACVYNMIVNANTLVNITTVSVYSENGARSFFDNKNTFGFYLLMGSLSTMFLRVHTKDKKWLAVSLLFIVNELMAMCRTAMLLSLVILMMSLILNGKKTGRRLLVALFIIIGGYVIIKMVPVLDRYFFGSVLGDTESLEARELYIQNMLPLAREEHLWVGYGGDLSRTLARVYTGNRYFHNTYLYYLISGGVLQIALFVLSALYVTKNIITTIKRNKVIGVMCLVSLTVYLVYAWIESVAWFNTQVVSMIATVFAVSMPLLWRNATQYENDN